MKKALALSILISLSIACKKKDNKAYSFEKGNFKTYLENKKDSSTFYRVDKYQIESYRGKTDTFYINWKNKFEFHLIKKDPKSKLDSTNFIVKITKLKNNAYDFEAGYENSKFKQKGITYKITP